MYADFFGTSASLSLMHAHIIHISRLTAEMATCVESRAGKRLALDLSSAALQISSAICCTLRASASTT
jgi:hypothetical protein